MLPCPGRARSCFPRRQGSRRACGRARTRGVCTGTQPCSACSPVAWLQGGACETVDDKWCLLNCGGGLPGEEGALLGPLPAALGTPAAVADRKPRGGLVAGLVPSYVAARTSAAAQRWRALPHCARACFFQTCPVQVGASATTTSATASHPTLGEGLPGAAGCPGLAFGTWQWRAVAPSRRSCQPHADCSRCQVRQLLWGKRHLASLGGSRRRVWSLPLPVSLLPSLPSLCAAWAALETMPCRTLRCGPAPSTSKSTCERRARGRRRGAVWQPWTPLPVRASPPLNATPHPLHANQFLL